MPEIQEITVNQGDPFPETLPDNCHVLVRGEWTTGCITLPCLKRPDVHVCVSASGFTKLSFSGAFNVMQLVIKQCGDLVSITHFEHVCAKKKIAIINCPSLYEIVHDGDGDACGYDFVREGDLAIGLVDLPRLCILRGMAHIAGKIDMLYICDVPRLRVLEGLCNIEQSNLVCIKKASSLVDLRGLERLRCIGCITGPPKTPVYGPPIPPLASLKSAPFLRSTRVAASHVSFFFGNCDTGKGLILCGNPNLKSLDGLESLRYVSNMEITVNAPKLSIQALLWVECMRGHFRIEIDANTTITGTTVQQLKDKIDKPLWWSLDVCGVANNVNGLTCI